MEAAMNKSLAEESSKTRKTREKLKNKLEEIEAQVTEAALKRKAHEIERWIARHAPHRVTLKKKTIALFDNNQNPADISRRVAGIAEKFNA